MKRIVNKILFGLTPLLFVIGISVGVAGMVEAKTKITITGEITAKMYFIELPSDFWGRKVISFTDNELNSSIDKETQIKKLASYINQYYTAVGGCILAVLLLSSLISFLGYVITKEMKLKKFRDENLIKEDDRNKQIA